MQTGEPRSRKRSTERCEVLVIGGGPAGSTVAALLAERGRDVVVIEKDRHPRFHIGESLLPLNLPLFERLGVRESIERIAMLKYGVEFVSPDHKKAVRFDFDRAWNKTFPYAYQVRRSEFDHLLLKNAAAKGARIFEGTRITKVRFLPDGGAEIDATDDQELARSWTVDFVIDASGRDAFLASQLGMKQRNRKHGSAAIFAHFTGARRLPGKAEGNISIFWFADGWFWFIPLKDGATSVGAVCPPEYFKGRNGDLTAFFMSTIAKCPEIAERLNEAELSGPVVATGNYSYRAARMTGRNFVLVGDAFAFIDPVFSTGVYLAMTMAFFAADAVCHCLDKPQEAARALCRYEKQSQRGIKAFSWYIYRIRMPAFRNLVMSPRNIFRIDEAVLSLLAGDVFGGSSIGARLAVFKSIYYVTSLFHLVFRLYTWRERRRSAALETAI
jgi:flavin-dependent dehydrogenase